MVHHHFIGQVGSELSFMDFLVEQRLKGQSPKAALLIITITNTWLQQDVQFKYGDMLLPSLFPEHSNCI